MDELKESIQTSNTSMGEEIVHLLVDKMHSKITNTSGNSANNKQDLQFFRSYQTNRKNIIQIIITS